MKNILSDTIDISFAINLYNKKSRADLIKNRVNAKLLKYKKMPQYNQDDDFFKTIRRINNKLSVAILNLQEINRIYKENIKIFNVYDKHFLTSYNNYYSTEILKLKKEKKKIIKSKLILKTISNNMTR